MHSKSPAQKPCFQAAKHIFRTLHFRFNKALTGMLALKFLCPLTQPFGCNVDFSAQIMDVVYDFCFSGCNCFPAFLIPCKSLLRGFITGEFYKLLCGVINVFLQKREIFLIGTVGFTRGNALDKIQLLRIKKRNIRVKLTGFNPLTQCLQIFFGVPDFLFTLLFPFSQFMLSLFCLFLHWSEACARWHPCFQLQSFVYPTTSADGPFVSEEFHSPLSFVHTQDPATTRYL